MFQKKNAFQRHRLDPVAPMYGGQSPYNSMFNDPVALSDPMGDDPLSGAIIGAGIGLFASGIYVAANAGNLESGQGSQIVLGATAAGALIGAGVGLASGDNGNVGLNVGSSGRRGNGGLQSADDIIFSYIDENGNKSEIGRLITTKIRAEFVISQDNTSGVDLSNLSFPPVNIEDKIQDLANLDAISVDVTGGGVYYAVGGQVQLSLIGILKGVENGQSAFSIQPSLIFGLEGGVSGSVSFYRSLIGKGLRLNDLSQGWEIGWQVDTPFFGGSYFEGFRVLKSGYNKRVYSGTSLSFGIPGTKSPFTFSTYLGHGFRLSN